MKLLAALLLILGLIPTSHAADTNTYHNPTLGVTIAKPEKWQFTTAAQNAENLERTKMKDEELQKLVQKHASAPLVAMMKHPEPFDDLNPSFKVTLRPLGTLAGKNPKEIIKLVMAPMEKMFEDFTLETPPKDETVSGLKGAYAKIHYTLKTAEGLSFPTCSELWIVPRGKNVFIIGSGTRQDEKTGTRDEIKKILDSLKLEKE